MTVFVTDAVLFSQIELVHSRFPDEKISIEYVNKEDARKFQLLIQGLMVAEKESIDVTGIPQPQLVNKLKQVGHTAVNTIQG